MEDILSYQYIQQVILAATGGFFLNMLNLHQDSRRKKIDRTTKDILYFCMFLFWPIAGGVLGYIYVESGNTINSILAFHIGISAPTILQSLVDKAASPPSAPDGSE